MAKEAEKDLTCNSPAAIMAIWIDGLARERGWGDHQEKVLLTLDYHENKLEHIKISDPDDKYWSEHFKRKKQE